VREATRDVSGSAAIQALKRLGFEVTRQVGSHVRLAKAEKRVSVPLHRALVPRTL
jgi:predicted RNA binding protein YcfA (HicA-like mRNA interferase family)